MSQNEAEKNLKSLLYLRAKEWTVLPRWTEGYREIGAYYSRHLKKDKTLTLVIVVPTRSFVAAMICLGVVQSYLDSSDGEDSDSHLDKIRKLPKNSPLILQQKGTVQRVFFDSIIQESGQSFIRVLSRNEKRKMCQLHQLIPERNAHLLKSLSEDQTKPTKKSVGQELQSEFLFEYLGTEKALIQIMKGDLDCKIVGIERFLKKEITETEIGFRNEKAVRKGFLNDMLLVKQFVGGNEVFLSQVINSTKADSKNRADSKKIILFDGAKSFLDCKMNFTGNSSVVILDRTDKNFKDALEIVNQDIHRSDSWIDVSATEEFLPYGVEISMFEVPYA